MWFIFITARLLIFLSFQPRLAATLLRSCSVVNSLTRRAGLSPAFRSTSLAQHLIELDAHLRILRLFLGFAAFAWGISIAAVFLSWSFAVDALRGLGSQPIACDHMLDYWLRMALRGIR
jgi:hypothetical protein